MKIRTEKPKNNKYYIRQANGGYNGAIQGSPVDPSANVLANCVGYANGRFNEIIGAGRCKYQLVCNAENFIERAKALGLKVSSKPVVGGIMVWQKGATLQGSDGAGHVAIVEKIIDKNTIYTSESAWSGKAFFNATRSNSNGRWGMASGYKFRGCIVNPAIKEDSNNTSNNTSAKVPVSKTRKYKVVSKTGMNVRKTGSTSALIVGTLNYGQVFTSSKQSNGWVYCDARKGWVKTGKDYIKEI